MMLRSICVKIILIGYRLARYMDPVHWTVRTVGNVAFARIFFVFVSK